jgi:triosephosphate isomerase
MKDMREMIIAGNWKMHKTLDSAIELTDEILEGLRAPIQSNVILGIPFPFLSLIGDRLKEQDGVNVAAQNIYPKDEGAFTGEVSAPMLSSCGVDHVIVGHSERRQYFNEDNNFIRKKLNYSISKGLRTILCIGEPLQIRDKNEHESFVLHQIKECTADLHKEHISQLIVAYEPVWAIGTGRTAEPEQAQEMHQSIRTYLKENYGEAGKEAPILYGGSMKPKNAESLLSCPDIDGGLIGGASLKSASFLEIIEIAEKLN